MQSRWHQPTSKSINKGRKRVVDIRYHHLLSVSLLLNDPASQPIGIKEADETAGPGGCWRVRCRLPGQLKRRDKNKSHPPQPLDLF